MENAKRPISFVVIGASGDLARKKIYPALFSLYSLGQLPEDFVVFGFARTPMDRAEFLERIGKHLTCRYAPEEHCPVWVRGFLDRCHYVSGDYDSVDSFLELEQSMRAHEKGRHDRVFYLAIPPSVFTDTVRAIGDAGMVNCCTDEPRTHVVLEKPFGRDRRTSDELVAAVSRVFREEQIFRIDHYLGKEVIQNLLVLRFANLIFEPVWNRNYIRDVEIIWKEEIGVEGRGGYFDDFGIIRDVLQNHLLQILALLAMEPPSKFQAKNLAAEKLRVLEAIPPVRAGEIVIGQYTASTVSGSRMPGYREDPSVPADSRTPTFAAVRLQIENHRWKGVPFYVTAGKALDDKMTEIRVHFYELAHNIFCEPNVCLLPNRLVIRVQPDESISLYLTNKVPGMEMEIAQHKLDLQYETTFNKTIPEAYERLLLDVIHGDRSHFIGADELAAAWDVFSPILDQIEREGWEPQPYQFGGKGPQTISLRSD